MKTLAELGGILEAGKSYRIKIPVSVFPDVYFEEIIKSYKIVDKESNLGRIPPYERQLAAEDNYFAYENCMGTVSLFKIKDDYLIEEE